MTLHEESGLKRNTTALSHGRDESSTGVFRADEVSAKFTPYHDNVLVLMDWIRDMRKERTVGSLIVLGTQKPGKGEAVWATVVEAGAGPWLDEICNPKPGCNRQLELGVSVGQRVIVDSADQGDAVIVDGLEHRIIREHNILLAVYDET